MAKCVRVNPEGNKVEREVEYTSLSVMDAAERGFLDSNDLFVDVEGQCNKRQE